MIDADIADWRKSRQYVAAWQCLCENLPILVDSCPSVAAELWIDHFSGRFADTDNDESAKPPFAEPGFLFWSAARDYLAEHAYDLQSLERKIELQGKLLVDLALRLIPREASDPEIAQGAHNLISGALSAAQAAISLTRCVRRLEYMSSAEAVQTEPVWHAFLTCVRFYTSYWTGISEPFTNDMAPPRFDDIEYVSYAFRNLRIIDDFSASLSLLTRHTVPTVEISISMARRAIRWILGAESDSTGVQTEYDFLWVLLVGTTEKERVGTCARLQLTREVSKARAIVYPDPIYLGVLPVDSVWRNGFDNAIRAAQTYHKYPLSDTHRWSLRFLGPSDAFAVASQYLEEHRPDLFRRPIAIEGDSASAALACLLILPEQVRKTAHRTTISAAIDNDGTLAPVAHVIAKLDDRIWSGTLRSQVDRALVYSGLKGTLPDWIRTLASTLHKGLVQELDSLGSALSVFETQFKNSAITPPKYVEQWLPTDQPPTMVEFGEVAVDRRPRKSRLIKGMYADRTHVFNTLRRRLSDWSEEIEGRDDEDETIPIFWIGGASGTGKSVSLLYSIAFLAQRQDSPVFKLARPDDLPAFITWLAEQESHPNQVIVAIDDPYAPSIDNRHETWRNSFIEAQSLSEKYGQYKIPCIVCCGPTEQRNSFSDDFGQFVQMETYDLPNDIQDERSHLLLWYSRRTRRPIPSIPEGNVLIVQLFWEWNQNQPIHQFAQSLKRRILGIDKTNGTSLYELACQILAFNRLYIGYPQILLRERSPRELDFYEMLAQEGHLETRADQDVNEVWLNHPHLAGLIYETWNIGHESQLDNLFTPLMTAHQLYEHKNLGAQLLNQIASAIFSSVNSSTGTNVRLPPTAWTRLCQLHSDWSDDPLGGLRESLPAWIFIRTCGVLGRATYPLAVTFRHDPLLAAIELLPRLRRTDLLREHLLNTMAYRQIRMENPIRRRVIVAVYNELLKSPEMASWARVASVIIGTTAHKKTAALAQQWISSYGKSSSPGWIRLWRTLLEKAKTGSRYDTTIALHLLDSGQHIAGNAWCLLWLSLWRYSGSAGRRELLERGVIWLVPEHAANTRWYLVWNALWKAEGAIEPSILLTQIAVSCLRHTNSHSSAWFQVWTKLMHRVTDESWRDALIEVASERRITHVAWPSLLRGVLMRTQRIAERDAVVVLLKRIVMEDRVTDPRWGTAFAVVWDNLENSEITAARKDLYKRAMSFLMESGQRRRRLDEVFGVWRRIWSYEMTFEERRKMIRFGLDGFKMIDTPSSLVKFAGMIRKILKSSQSKVINPNGGLMLEELILSSKRYHNSNNYWSHLWSLTVTYAKSSDLDMLMNAAIEWLESTSCSNEYWIYVFHRVLREGFGAGMSLNLLQAAISRVHLHDCNQPITSQFMRSVRKWLNKRDHTDAAVVQLRDELYNAAVYLLKQCSDNDPQWVNHWVNAARLCADREKLEQLLHTGIVWYRSFKTISVKKIARRSSQGDQRTRVIGQVLKLTGFSRLGLTAESIALECLITEETNSDHVVHLFQAWYVRYVQRHASSVGLRELSEAFSQMDAPCRQRIRQFINESEPTRDNSTFNEFFNVLANGGCSS